VTGLLRSDGSSNNRGYWKIMVVVVATFAISQELGLKRFLRNA